MATPRKETDVPRPAYSYRRVSDPSQVKGAGLARQEDFATWLCAKHGWRLDDSLQFDDEGKSAYHGHNLKPSAALTRCLECIRRGRITAGSVIIFEQIDRMSRQDVDVAYDVWREILKAGVWIATKEPERIYKRETTSFMDLMEPLWLMYLAHAESAKKAMRIADVWERQRQAVVSRKAPHQVKPPLWIARQDGRYVLIPERAAVVRRIFRMAASGMGAKRIVQTLEAEGYQALSRNGKWDFERVATILRLRTPVGEYQPRKHEGKRWIPVGPPIEGYYPAAVSEMEWQAAQRAVDSRRTTRGRPPAGRVNLFTGMVYETGTARPLILQTHPSRDGRVPVLATRRAGGVRLRYDLFELAVLGCFDEPDASGVIGGSDRLSAAQQRLQTGRAAHTALVHRRKQLQLMLADPRYDTETIGAALTENAKLLRAAEEEVRAAQWEVDSGRPEAWADVKSLHDAIKTSEGEERTELRQRIKEVLPSVLDRIEIRRMGDERRGGSYLATIRFRGRPERVVLVDGSVRYAT